MNRSQSMFVIFDSLLVERRPVFRASHEPVLYKKVRALLNMTVNDFVKTIKLKRAARMLKQGLSPADVSISIGYMDHKYFCREFKKAFGVTPRKWIDLPDAEQTY